MSAQLSPSKIAPAVAAASPYSRPSSGPVKDVSGRRRVGRGIQLTASTTLSASPAAVGRELFLRGERYLYCVAGRE